MPAIARISRVSRLAMSACIPARRASIRDSMASDQENSATAPMTSAVQPRTRVIVQR